MLLWLGITVALKLATGSFDILGSGKEGGINVGEGVGVGEVAHSGGVDGGDFGRE